MAARLAGMLAALHPRRAGLRLWLSLSYGLLAIGLVGALSVLLSRAASTELQKDIGLRLASHARSLAERFDEGLFERLNDMRALAILPGVDDPEENQATLRDLFDLMQLNYPDYAWIGVAEADGRVKVASRGLLEGADVSQRPWFEAGLKEPYVGDLHEALLLASLLPARSEPLRLIDVAAPIHDDHGVVIGVLGAHLASEWAEALRQEMLRPLLASDPVEIFVLDREGRIVLGPPEWRDRLLPVPSAARVLAGKSGSVLETWPDGREYLVGYAPTLGRAPMDSLGWTVLVRKDVNEAFAPVAALQRQIWLVALVSALVFVLAAVVMARLIGAPLQRLAASARLIQGRNADARFPAPRGYREARQLTQAMQGLFDDLTAREAELTAFTQQLEQRVRDRTAQLRDANAQLELLAMTDALTGLANRRYFGDQLTQEVARAAGIGKPVALVTLDIDHFKAINDQYGHPAGDAVLRTVALLLEEQVRGTDLLARVGGEEFAVLAVEAAMAEATQLGERLRAAVEGAGDIAVGRDAVRVTVSVGVAVLWPRAGDIVKVPERLLAGADDALYRAKRNGRNRVEVALP